MREPLGEASAGGRASRGGGRREGRLPASPSPLHGGSGRVVLSPLPFPPKAGGRRAQAAGESFRGRLLRGGGGKGLSTAGARTAKSPWAVIIHKHCEH